MTISLENWPCLKELEKVFYEKHAYEQLLAYMANNNIGNYQEYFNDYVKVIKEYRKFCKQLEKEMINQYLHVRKPLLADVDELFGTYTDEDQLRDAYRLKNIEIGYRQQQEEDYYM